MAGIWYAAYKGNWSICDRRIYDIPIQDKQLRRELRNSLHTPIHAVILAGFLYAGFFANRTWLSFFVTLALAFVWAEIWHDVSHRLMHWKPLHRIHVEHHRSHINSPFTAISFSFSEKLLFDLGYLGMLAGIDLVAPLNFFGIAAWYVGYLIINSFSHANFEFGRIPTTSGSVRCWRAPRTIRSTTRGIRATTVSPRACWIGSARPNGPTTINSTTASPSKSGR